MHITCRRTTASVLHLHLRLKFCVLFSTYSRLEASVDILTGTWSYMYEVLYKAITWQIRDSHFFFMSFALSSRSGH